MPTLRHGFFWDPWGPWDVLDPTLQVAQTYFTFELGHGEGTLRQWRTWSCGFSMIFDWVLGPVRLGRHD